MNELHLWRRIIQFVLPRRPDALSVATPTALANSDPLGVAQVAQHPPEVLQDAIPITRTLEERTLIATRCRDADGLPKVAGAGTVVTEADGRQIQIMHNGVRVIAGGYYGSWMTDLITRCHGHHEPQEEVMFAAVLAHVPPTGSMVELGGFWSYYSIWFLSQSAQRRSIVVEPDPAHMAIGQANAELNDCRPLFVRGFAGSAPAPAVPFMTERSGSVDLPCVSVASLLSDHTIEHLDILHCDAQGAELEVLQGCVPLAAAGRLAWVIVSTHSHHITGDPLTHQRCLAILCRAGATIVAEHSVQESFSGDGLIVAKFGALPDQWRTPALSYNRTSNGLFRDPLYDLAKLQRD